MKNRILFIIIMGCHVEVALTQIIPNPPGRPQKEPPTEYIKQIEDRYKRNKYNEISLKEYIEVYKNSYEVDSIVSRYLLSAANETLKTSAEETCTNGDISRWTPLGTSQLCPNGMFQELTGWWFAHSLVDNSGNVVNYSLSPYASSCADERARVFNAFAIPFEFYISQPPKSVPVLKLGNAINGAQADIAARKVTVDNNNKLISFWYAVVFEEPGHPPSDQPSFTVVVIDGSGNSYNNLVDLGNGSNKLVSGPDPFFQSGSGIIRYRNWTCAQIDLSNFQNGEQVEIHFIVEDCAQGKHYGYAYIDDFCDDCSGNPSGNILFGGCREPGKICIDYELPKQNTNTGSVALKLDIFQNGTLIGTLNSPSLNTGNNYCFDIDCLKFLNKIDLSTGYDVICTGTFKLGSSNVGTKKIGSIPDGSVLGINNDCSCSPSSVGEIKLTLGKDSCLTSFPFAIQGTFILPNRPDLKNQQISLQIIQNGVVVKTLSNPSISGSGYSFALNSADFPNGECFDLIAVLSFNLTDLNGNVQTVTQTSGNIKGGGIRPGFDNDICLNCPCCTIKDVDVALLDMDYTYLPNSAASSFKIKFKVKAGPFPIQQVRASVVDWKIHYDNEDCNRCANIPNAWASLSPDSQNPNLGVLTLKNENYTYSNAQNAPKDPDISLREIIWAGLGKFQNGQDGVMHLTIPSPPNIPCCISKMDVCIKFSIYDGNCNYCEKLICKTITIDDGSICKNKTFNTTSFFANNWFFSNDVTSTPIVGDFDNDGFIDDIAYRGKCDSGIEVWRMHLSNGTDFTTSCFSADNWFFNTDPTSTPVVGDFDNDGYLDDIAYRGRCNNNNTESWRMHIGSGSGFTTKCFTASNWFYSADITSTPVVGDFDNDGFMDDIAYRGKCYNGTEFWSIHFSNGAGFTTACYTANNWFNWSDASSTPVVGDFDNDGYMDDIAYRAKCGSGIEAWRIHFSNGSNFSTVSCYNASNWFDWSDPTSTPLVGDFDCDGFKDDIVYRGKCANGTESWRLHLSDGKNFTTTCYSANNWFQGNNVTNIPIVGDFDNDWYFDDIGYRGQCGNGGECWRMHIGN